MPIPKNNKKPEKLFNLPKQGFSIPLSDWIKGSLRDIINDNLTKCFVFDINY